MPYLNGTSIEIIRPDIQRGRIRYALFDFDGTLSLIREGWQQVMIPMMVEILSQTPAHEIEAELRALVTEYVEQSTGMQTIYQMIRLGQEVAKRGRQPAEPLEYKRKYNARLWERIQGRVVALKAGQASPDELMVPGSLAMLKALQARGLTCYLASGTDEAYVLDEATALGLLPYFAGIYGALDDYKRFSKRMVIDRIVQENHLRGSEFVAFGDGYVEIENAKAVGGIAVGVASNEAARSGIDAWKRHRLIQAGADLIIPDFREHERLVAYLFAEN